MTDLPRGSRGNCRALRGLAPQGDMSEATLKALEERARLLEFDGPLMKETESAVMELIHEFWRGIKTTKTCSDDKEICHKIQNLVIGDQPRPLSEVLNLFTEAVLTPGLASVSARHFGNIPSGGLPISAYAELLATATNKHPGLMSGAPGVVAVENSVLAWAADLFGFDRRKFGGVLTAGGSTATQIAFVAAREAAGLRGANYDTAVVYASSETHFCADKTLRFLGLHDTLRRSIAVDQAFRIDTGELELQMAADVGAGLQPFLIIGNAGTTNTGSIDDLEKLSALARKYDCWFHVDAAYGGFFNLVKEKKEAFKGIEKADSVIVDPHKGLFIPHGCGICLVKNIKHLIKTYCYRANYLEFDEEDQLNQFQFAPTEVSPELTRSFRGLRVWMPLLLYGVDVFRDTLKEKLLLVKRLYERLTNMENVEVGPYPELSVVLFRFVDKKDLKLANEMNQDIVAGLRQDGRVHITTTLKAGSWSMTPHPALLDRKSTIVSPPMSRRETLLFTPENQMANNESTVERSSKEQSNMPQAIMRESGQFSGSSKEQSNMLQAIMRESGQFSWSSEQQTNMLQAMRRGSGHYRSSEQHTSGSQDILPTLCDVDEPVETTWIRFCILSFRSHQEDVDLAVHLLLDAREKYLAKG